MGADFLASRGTVARLAQGGVLAICVIGVSLMGGWMGGCGNMGAHQPICETKHANCNPARADEDMQCHARKPTYLQ